MSYINIAIEILNKMIVANGNFVFNAKTLLLFLKAIKKRKERLDAEEEQKDNSSSFDPNWD
jgi:hypothetical protein